MPLRASDTGSPPPAAEANPPRAGVVGAGAPGSGGGADRGVGAGGGGGGGDGGGGGGGEGVGAGTGRKLGGQGAPGTTCPWACAAGAATASKTVVARARPSRLAVKNRSLILGTSLFQVCSGRAGCAARRGSGGLGEALA